MDHMQFALLAASQAGYGEAWSALPHAPVLPHAADRAGLVRPARAATARALARLSVAVAPAPAA